MRGIPGKRCFFALLFFIKIFDAVHTAAHVGKEGVHQSQSGHGFHNHHCTGHNDWIMTAVNLQGEAFAVFGYGFLGLADGGVGFT